MTKKELKYYLRIYPLINFDAVKIVDSIEIKIYGRKKKVLIPEWFYKAEEILRLVEKSENNLIVSRIINKVYMLGANDKQMLSELPITESSYYRLKRDMENKIYQMFIVNGFVNESEILANKIIY